MYRILNIKRFGKTCEPKVSRSAVDTKILRFYELFWPHFLVFLESIEMIKECLVLYSM